MHLRERLAIAPAAAYPLFDDLVARYREPHRHYHNLEHISEVLQVISRLIDTAANPDAIYLAAWYHDAIYDPRSKDNEERSAFLAAQTLGTLPLSPELIEKTGQLIRATAHTSERIDDIDAHILLDADLAILAAETRRYQRYAEAIRKEYSSVGEVAYRAGRSQVLRSFLGRPRIYHTVRMFEVGEGAARRNIARELEVLHFCPLHSSPCEAG